MPHFYDPQTALTTDWRTFFLENRDEIFTLPCIEREVELNGRWMLLNIMLCMPLIKRNRPISADKHLMTSGIYGATEHAKRETEICRSLEEYGYTREELGHDIISTVMDAHNMCYTHLGQFVRTMDIFAIADTVLQDEVTDLCTMDYGDLEDKQIKRMEREFNEKAEVMFKTLSGDTISNNVFRAPLLCGALKKGQFYQFVLSAGPRTDTDDRIFLRPVVGSFLSGMRDIKDLAIESRSASKATHYQKTQMSNTQYQNRKFHIQGSAMWHLYPGDCGSKVFMTYTPTKENVKHFVGKFYLDGTGRLIELTKERFNDVVDKVVKFRDVIGCNYVDGYCEVCGGTITKSFSRNGNVGFLSNVNTGAPVAQQVLSTKHLISTDAAEYEVPSEFGEIFSATMNNVFIRQAHKNKLNSLAIGFQMRDISKLNDLKYIDADNDLHAEYYTDIKYMYLGRVREDGAVLKISPRVSMSSDTKTYPHLSPEILNIIRNTPEDITIQNGIAWLLLRNVDVEAPVLQCTVVNNSIKQFVGQFANLIAKDVERYTSANDFMRDLTKLIWSRVGTHITHISCLARSCMVTSKKDFHVPIVTDPDNVMFGTLGKIIPMRSIGALMAFERYNLVTNKPVTYITPKREGIMDAFMGYTDTIERDMTYPEGYDRLELE